MPFFLPDCNLVQMALSLPSCLTFIRLNPSTDFCYPTTPLSPDTSDEWTTVARPYNSIGDTVEWRIRGGEPVAFILRYNFMTDGLYPERTSELAVTSIGREGSPGWLIEWVEADAQPNQNAAARQVADQQAEGFDCDSSSSGPANGEPTAEAGKDKTVELTFASGASRATVGDTLAGFAHDYLVQASAGQSLQATLRSDGPPLMIVIENDEYQPDAVQALPSTTAEALTSGSGEPGGWIWEGVLPDDGGLPGTSGSFRASGPSGSGESVLAYCRDRVGLLLPPLTQNRTLLPI